MQPVAPRSKTNPSGTTRLIQAAEKQLKSRIKSVRDGVIDWINSRPYTVIEVNSLHCNVSFYEFALDPYTVDQMDLELDRLIRLYIFNPSDSLRSYFMSQYAMIAYEQSTTAAISNISAQVDYGVTVEQVLTSQPYSDRLSVTANRTFEEMAGFGGDMKAALNRIMTDGMSAGNSPMTIARQIRDSLDQKYRRAKTIARTEINNAHRQALYQEDLRAERLGVTTRLMHFSALIPGRTRKTHAQRHGWIGTRAEEQEWYSKDGNAINCLCTPLTVVTDIHGKPISEKFVQKQVDARKKFL